MGIDFLDITFRLEKKFKIKIPRGWFTEISEHRKPFDLTAGELADSVMKLLPPNISAADARGEICHDAKCLACGENIRGLRLENYCPQCGSGIAMKEQVWACIRQVLQDALGVKVNKIRRESVLMRDLGAS